MKMHKIIQEITNEVIKIGYLLLKRLSLGYLQAECFEAECVALRPWQSKSVHKLRNTLRHNPSSLQVKKS